MDDRSSNVVSMGRIELIVDPQYGDLWTGPAPIVRGTRMTPLQEIRVEVTCLDGKGRVWKSANAFLVSAEGIFDTSLTAAIGEGYYGVAQEGPFYSMACVEGPGHDFAWRELGKIDYRIACFDGDEEIWFREISRYIGRSEDSRPEPHARVYYFDDNVASDDTHAALALSAHGVAVSILDPRVSTVAAHGEALPIVIVASGRASARALEIAIRWPTVHAVVLFSGGGLRFDPFDDGRPDHATGEWIPQPLDHISLDHSSLQPRAEGILSTRRLYAEAVADRTNRDRGRIEVEKLACPLYMFSGLDDQIWPSSAFSELAAQRRKMKDCPFPTYHRTFEGVGHDLGPSLGLPTLPTTERTVSHPDTGFRLLLGGKGGRQARARRECWETLLAILAGNPPTP